MHAFERKIQNIPTPKKYSARPGNALLGITDAKEEIIMSNKNYFETADHNFRTACCMYATRSVNFKYGIHVQVNMSYFIHSEFTYRTDFHMTFENV